MKRKLTTLLLVAALLVGVGLLLYPTVSNYWNSFHQSRAINSYTEQVATMDTELYEKMIAAARAYNETLVGKKNRYFPTDEEKAEYESLLNLSGDGLMGYVEIPCIHVSLAISHGTGERVLQTGVGHIEGTSLPVGGLTTHCALSGHRGLPSARLFTDLDDLIEGDTFVLNILNEKMTYQVDQIRKVLPNEMDDLAIQEGKDFCTLVTCTPYGVNTHRLLVRGHRVANEKEMVIHHITADATRVRPVIVAPVLAAPVLVIMLLFVFAPGGNGKRKKGRAT